MPITSHECSIACGDKRQCGAGDKEGCSRSGESENAAFQRLAVVRPRKALNSRRMALNLLVIEWHRHFHKYV